MTYKLQFLTIWSGSQTPLKLSEFTCIGSDIEDKGLLNHWLGLV